MYTCAQLHPGLAALLEFEEQRLGIPVEVERKPLYNCDAFPTARPVIEVRIHTGTRPETFPVLLADELLEVTAPVCVEPGSQEVGFKDATGRLCPLASVIGNVVNVYFDLDEVFSFPVNVRRKPTNGGALAGHPGNRLAELIFSQALAIAVGNIRRLD